jgi:hypothetical protein
MFHLDGDMAGEIQGANLFINVIGQEKMGYPAFQNRLSIRK